jgi:ATP-dependent helicase/nuclease subunit A
MPLTPEQELAVNAPRSVAVTAGAGTGKTHLLTQRYLHHLTVDEWSPLQIVAVTFTEKAADELRARIRSAVTALPTAAEDDLAEIEAAQISTIHALAQRICRDHYDLAGIPPDFSVLDEQEGAIWRAEHFASALEAVPLETYRAIPFTRLSQAMWTFLADPIAADAALSRGPEEWAALVEAARTEELAGLRAGPTWRSAGAELRAMAGPPGDLIENQRAVALAAWTAIESGEPPAAHLSALNSLNLRGGSGKKWGPDEFAAIKQQLTQLRLRVKDSYPLLCLELCPADFRVAELLPQLREAFRIVREYIGAAKLRSRKLDFNDLESYALRVLQNPQAREFYAVRWGAFLIDEFQDTNPVQGELLRLLTEDARVTIVGDEQQAIYGFRRAEVQVFNEYRERITSLGGETHQLTVTYRAHEELTKTVNGIFAPVLGALHRPLSASRSDAPNDGPHVTALVVQTEEKVAKSASQRVEAAAIARTVREWLDDRILVHDKPTGTLRAIRPGDIAVLSRTWSALDYYGDALAAAGIPAVHAGGGNLLAVREVMDAIGLLTFLADPQDDLALVATLRSPHFALSDSDLYRFANTLKSKAHWWPSLEGPSPAGFERAVPVLAELLTARQTSTPRQLMQLADALTGYSAVVANLARAARREADLRGFLELLSKWERDGHDDVFAAVRQMRVLVEAGVDLPRPPLEAGNAVALMTVHAAKGLEWPAVIVPDLARTNRSESAAVRLDPQLGVAFAIEDEDEEAQKPAILTLIDRRRKQREADEERRILYVAITRARDRVLLTSTAERGPAWEILVPGFEAAGINVEAIPFNSADAAPPDLGDPAPVAKPERVLMESVPRTVSEVRVTDLHEYSICPKRFHYHVVLGFPDPTREEPESDVNSTDQDDRFVADPLFELMVDETSDADEKESETAAAETEMFPLFAAIEPEPAPPPADPAITPAEADALRRIGILAHRSLELDLTDVAGLAVFDKTLSSEQVAEAMELADRFRHDPAFAEFQDQARGHFRREWPVVLEQNGVRLIGTIDLAGPDFVLDFKTGLNVSLDEHRFQLWAYARAVEVEAAYLADLRAGKLQILSLGELDLIGAEVELLLERMRAADFTATPSAVACSRCPYDHICPDAFK